MSLNLFDIFIQLKCSVMTFVTLISDDQMAVLYVGPIFKQDVELNCM